MDPLQVVSPEVFAGTALFELSTVLPEMEVESMGSIEGVWQPHKKIRNIR